MSRYYTNVDIPELFCSQERMQDDLKINILRIEILQKKVEYLHSILENIPNAIEEFGYVDLSYDNGKKQMKIGKLNET